MPSPFLHRRLVLRAAALAAATVLLAACVPDKPAFLGTDISGSNIGKDWALTAHNGQPRSLPDFAGKAVVVFFGFTQCPDVCPASLAELAQVMHKLGSAADRVQVLLITVDPERDTPQVLREYVTAFDPRFLGLTGTPEQIKHAAGAFKVYYAKAQKSDGSYSMDHTAAFYLFDTRGEPRVLMSNNAGVDALTHDLKLLVP